MGSRLWASGGNHLSGREQVRVMDYDPVAARLAAQDRKRVAGAARRLAAVARRDGDGEVVPAPSRLDLNLLSIADRLNAGGGSHGLKG